MGGGQPAQLGADNVIRFVDRNHFLQELTGNLGRGRAFVRTPRSLPLQTQVQLDIEAPGVQWRVPVQAIVVFVRDGFIGLEFEDFESVVLPKLDALGREAEIDDPPVETTVVGPVPLPRDETQPAGQAFVHFSEEDEMVGPYVRRRPLSLKEETEEEMEVIAEPRRNRRRRPHPTPSAAPEKVVDASESDTTESESLSESEDSLDAFPSPDQFVEYEAWSPKREATDRGATAIEPPNESPVTPPPKIESQDLLLPEVATPAVVEDPSTASLDLLASEAGILRATASGVIRVKEPEILLGAYLGQARHGVLTLFGGPSGDIGEKVVLKIACGGIATVDSEIIARVAEWVTLRIPDATPIAELVASRTADLGPSLSFLEPADAPTPEPKPEIPDAATTAEQSVVEPEPEKAVEPAATATSKAKEPPKSPAPSEPDAAPAAEPPTLKDGIVCFSSMADLEREFKTNLENGGLFVDSPPIPLRSSHSLALQVADVKTPVKLQAEVVFADAGRVGFSLSKVAEAIKQIKWVLERDLETLRSEKPGTIDMVPDLLGDSADLTGQQRGSGTISVRLTDARLLDLQSQKLAEGAEVKSAPVMLVAEYLFRRNGKYVLTLQTDSHALDLYIHQGSVAFVARRPFDEAAGLGRILVNMKRLNEAGLRQGLEASKQAKRSLGRTLVGLGLIKKSDLSNALREQTRILTNEAFNWDVGSYEWSPWRDPPGDADLVLSNGVGLLAHHLRLRYEGLKGAEIDGLLGANMGRAVRIESDIDRYATTLHLQPKELRFLNRLVGDKPISDVVLGSPIGRLASVRLIAKMISLGLVQFTDGSSKVVREKTSIKVAPTAFTNLKKSLEERMQILRTQNYFEIVGVHWSSHQRNHRSAFQKLKQEFDLAKTPLRDAPDEIKAMAKAILDVIDEAWRTLSDREQRIKYRGELFDKTERQYAADMLVKKGELALMRSDRVSAIEALETAVELEPSSRNLKLLKTARSGRM